MRKKVARAERIGYSQPVQLYAYYLIFPDGDRVETARPPRMTDILDANGFPHRLPLRTEKTLAFRIAGKRTMQQTGLTAEFYLLEQMSAAELLAYVE